ncbi:hypothetical protein JR316_0012898 [Psilocybe cubensis]|uniref:F-box domain-containing protein n=2 Tax=Psilocybe cubensis TaxID=181762 RepID=A0A8H7XQF6_PSICU|nr:hypothetical protein JR316_0012898 [Psilocybe cubensis]KAH9474439.1 hypothetical protein JR316_0012898 [Psilocybe cubensis]
MTQGQTKALAETTTQAQSATHYSISFIPTEILHEIVSLVENISGGRKSLANLCLASRQLRAIAQPLLLSRVNIGTSGVLRVKMLGQLKDLASGVCSSSLYARTLTIDYRTSFPDARNKSLYPNKTEFLNYLPAALESFKNIEKVVWYVGKNGPGWLHQAIGDGMRTWKLRELSVEPQSDTEIFHPINSGSFIHILRRLLLSAKHLVYVQVHGFNPSYLLSYFPNSIEHLGCSNLDCLIPQETMLLPGRLKNLRSLYIRTDRPHWSNYRDDDCVWDAFRKTRCNATHIQTNTHINDGFISYIESIRNVQQIILELNTPWNPVQASVSDTPLRVISSLSTHHADSLLVLDDIKAKLLLLSKLENLELSVGGSSVQDVHSLLSFCDTGFLSLQSLTLHFPSLEHINKKMVDKNDNTVNILLETKLGNRTV